MDVSQAVLIVVQVGERCVYIDIVSLYESK